MAAPTITVYKNGDTHFAGKKVVVAKRIRTLDSFLDKVTRDVRMQVAVRSIRTPNHGTRVSGLEKLQNGGVYVAVGPEKFKTLMYSNIQGVSPFRRAKTVDVPTVRPVFHSRIHASARYGKVAEAEALQNRIIHVYRNGEDKHPGIKLLLDKRVLASMDQILQFVTHKINLRTGAVKALYDLDGVIVLTPQHIKSGTRYVAVGYGRSYQKIDYAGIVAPQLTPRKAGRPKTELLSPLSGRKSKKINAKPAKQASAPDKSKNQEAWKKHLEEKKKEPSKASPKDAPSPSFFEKVVDLAEDAGINTDPVVKPSEDFKEDLTYRLENIENELVTDDEAVKQRKPAVPVSPEKVFDKALRSTKSNSESSLQRDQGTSNDVPDNEELPVSEQPEEIEIELEDQEDEGSEDLRGEGGIEVPGKSDELPEQHEEIELEEQSEADQSEARQQRSNSIDDDNIDDEEDAANTDVSTWRNSSGPYKPKSTNQNTPKTEHEEAAGELTEEIMANSEKNIKKINEDTVFAATGKQAEAGEHIKDTTETTLEKTVDQLPDEEVDEEIVGDADNNPEVPKEVDIKGG